MEQPAELAYAQVVVGLCDRLHKLPSEVLAEDATMLRLFALVAAGTPRTDEEGYE